MKTHVLHTDTQCRTHRAPHANNGRRGPLCASWRSRASGCALFDADVDAVVRDADPRRRRRWERRVRSRGAELIRARVPIVTGKDASTTSRSTSPRPRTRRGQAAPYGGDLNDASFSQHRPPHFASTVRLCKVVLRQTGLGGAYGGGLGSFALCALVFDILRRASHGTPSGAALGALRGLGSVHTYARPVHLGDAVVDDESGRPGGRRGGILREQPMRRRSAPCSTYPGSRGRAGASAGGATTVRRPRPVPSRGVKRPRVVGVAAARTCFACATCEKCGQRYCSPLCRDRAFLAHAATCGGATTSTACPVCDQELRPCSMCALRASSVYLSLCDALRLPNDPLDDGRQRGH